MAKQRARAVTHQTQISGYERLARRIQSVISTPRAQVERQAVISRQLDDQQSDWDRLLEELRDTDGVTMTPRSDGSVHLAWQSEVS
jgi:Tfp pilus assembly protein PilN